MTFIALYCTRQVQIQIQGFWLDMDSDSDLKTLPSTELLNSKLGKRGNFGIKMFADSQCADIEKKKCQYADIADTQSVNGITGCHSESYWTNFLFAAGFLSIK